MARAPAGTAGLAAAVLAGGGFVVLDTTVTPELAAEGLARDVIRVVQQARRDAGLARRRPDPADGRGRRCRCGRRCVDPPEPRVERDAGRAGRVRGLPPGPGGDAVDGDGRVRVVVERRSDVTEPLDRTAAARRTSTTDGAAVRRGRAARRCTAPRSAPRRSRRTPSGPGAAAAAAACRPREEVVSQSSPATPSTGSSPAWSACRRGVRAAGRPAARLPRRARGRHERQDVDGADGGAPGPRARPAHRPVHQPAPGRHHRADLHRRRAA